MSEPRGIAPRLASYATSGPALRGWIHDITRNHSGARGSARPQLEVEMTSMQRRQVPHRRPANSGCAAAAFKITVEEERSRASGLRLHWSEQTRRRDWANLTEGTYVLRSNVADWSPEVLWRTYTQLHEAEAAFRIHKSDLRILPIWHQRADRVQAHILVCFFAYAM